MAIQTAAMRAKLADAYAAAAAFGTIYTTVPGASAGTEPSGGSPAFARKPLTWSATGSNPTTASPTFDVPAGTSAAGAGVHSALTLGTYYDGTTVTPQTFASQGTYTVTFTFTES